MNDFDELKNLLEDPSFTLDNLRTIITEPKSEWKRINKFIRTTKSHVWSFDDRLTIPILRKIINRYPELDMDDIKEMYLNPDFFDEEFDVQDNEETIQKYFSLIPYWKYENHIGVYVATEPNQNSK